MTGAANRDATVTANTSPSWSAMSEQNPKIAVLETKLSTMSDDIAHIRATVDSLVSKLSQLPAMEEKSKGQSQAIERAFNEIDKIKGEVNRLEMARQAERDRVNRWIYGISGAALAFSIVWGALGVYVTDSVRGLMRTNDEMRAYLLAQQRYQFGGERLVPAER